MGLNLKRHKLIILHGSLLLVPHVDVMTAVPGLDFQYSAGDRRLVFVVESPHALVLGREFVSEHPCRFGFHQRGGRRAVDGLQVLAEDRAALLEQGGFGRCIG